jgi:hypothetical protein
VLDKGCNFGATLRAGPSCSVHAAKRRAVTSIAGNGTVFRDGRTESGLSVGDVAVVRDCATLPKTAIYDPGKLFRALGTLPRPDLWLPYVFTHKRKQRK